MKSLSSLLNILKKIKEILTLSQKRWGLVILLFSLIGAVFETLGVSIILPLVSAMMTPEILWNNELIQKIALILDIESDKGLILLLCGGVILVYIIKNLYLILLSFIRVKYACKVQRELSIEMMESYMGREYLFFVRTNKSEILRGITTSIQNTFNALLQILRITAEVLTLICICIFVMITDFMMAMIIVLLSFGCLICVAYGFKTYVKKTSEKGFKYVVIINKLVLQAFEGIKEIFVMQRQKYFRDEYRKNYSGQEEAWIGMTMSAEIPTNIVEVICVSGLMMIVGVKILLTGNPEILIPQLAAFAIAAFRILPSLGRISSYFNQFMGCIPSVEETYNNFLEVREGKSRELSDKKEIDSFVFKKELRIDNVCWTYSDEKSNILDNLSLRINKGEAIALIGASGSGKTTLADIILGLLKPKSGEIFLDGEDIFELYQNSSNIIGFVPQNAYLMDDTLRNNIAFGIEEEKISDKLIWKSLEQAQLKEFVERLPEGLDTIVGERGIRFSGGQRQRIAIARALYCNPDILVLDEATSALDNETEKAVMDAIDALQGEKTLIIIAHRLSTIKNCDHIYEILEGKAIERNKEELFKE